jgi:hypothetical protein
MHFWCAKVAMLSPVKQWHAIKYVVFTFEFEFCYEFGFFVQLFIEECLLEVSLCMVQISWPVFVSHSLV